MKNKATNSAYMKQGNKRLVLNIIRKKPVSRAELARITGLTRAAVTLLVEELINDGILIETGTAEADFGRKPVLLDLNPVSCYAIGVSIVRDGCHIGIANIRGQLLAKRRVNIEACSNADECMKVIASEIRAMIDESSISNDRILGVGISAPGPIDIYTGTILNPPGFNRWHNVNVIHGFGKEIPFEIHLENNSASLALAEKSYGRGTEFGSFILMVVDSGIGAGIILNDQLYRGDRGFGSEIGHTSINIHGPRCSCGNRGCLEVYASIPSVIREIKKIDPGISTWRSIVDRALDGDEACMKAIEQEAIYLSAGIVNAINIFEPEAVILTGDINYRPETLLEKIRSNVESSAMNRNIRKLHIMNSSVTRDPEVIAAASVIIEKYFRGELEGKRQPCSSSLV